MARQTKQNFSSMAPTTQHKDRFCLSVSSSSTSISITNIPTDVIIFKILLLMETKTLGRLRCVSRWWNTLISSSIFCLLYYRFRSQLQLPHQINWNLVKHDSGNYEYLFSTTDPAHPLHHNTWTFHHSIKHTSMVSESSCFGLICLYGFNSACIYNPTTRTVVVNLPSCNDNSCWLPIFVLGLVPSTNQFKVLCFSTGPSFSHTFPGYKNCKALTLPEDLSGGWRKVASPPSSDIHEPVIASAEGAVYILSRRREHLFRFDLEREKWSEIKLPTLANSLSCVEFEKCLCLVVTTIEFCYEVWILKDCNVWERKWVLNECPNVAGGLLLPLHYDEKLGRILMRNIFGHLSWYWIKQGTYEHLSYLYECPRTRRYNISYVETLASLETLRDFVDVNHLQL